MTVKSCLWPRQWTRFPIWRGCRLDHIADGMQEYVRVRGNGGGMTRFEKTERKGPSRRPGQVQAICIVSDLKTGAIALNGMISLLTVGNMYRYRQSFYSVDECK